jgi:succinate dehydrogenase/fumarate reductase flavoprotein subunit
MGSDVLKEELVEADVLCVGGGPAGLMAAIHASELGTKVIVAEKGNTLRSGAGATGNDHFTCYIPEIHGDIEPLVRTGTRQGLSRHAGLVRTLFEKSFDIVKLWESWGIPTKYKGRYEFAGHTYPGAAVPATSLKFHGQDQKPILTKEARKRGVKIINRVMVLDLLRDGGVIGALGVDTREEKLIKFQAKSVVLGTGILTRLYPSPTPGWMFNIGRSPATTGDGRVMAYRAGAELINLELPRRWAGPKYFIRHGKASWVGVLRDPEGKPVGPFVTKPDKRYGDAASDIYATLFEDYWKSGKGPVYMDCAGISDEDFEYMLHWLKQEGNTALVNYLNEEGIDPRKSPVEFTTYEILPMGGVYHNEKGETSVKGVYAAGDELVGAGLAGAAVFGWIAGENAAKYAKSREPVNIERARAKVDERKGLIQGILGREVGPSWREVNIALQQIMYDYAGSIRSKTQLEAGLSYLQRLRGKACTTMRATNQHELMRCLEALNLLDLGELVFIMAMERKETRARHVRTDYPYTNPLMDKMLVIKKIDDRPVVEWREVRP